MTIYEELILGMTISYYKEAIPNYTDEQIKFAEDITSKLITDTDTTKINAVPAPCGFGKSVLIRCFLKANLILLTNEMFGKGKKEYEGDGFVVVTDLLDRFFKGYEKDKELSEHCYLMYYEKGKDVKIIDFQTQATEQNNFPILLMTTQKYFKLSESEKGFIFKYKKGKRKTVIFDEKPEFYSVTEIDKESINSIDNNVDLIKETDDKNFLNQEIKYLRDYFEEEKSKLSSKSDDDVITYWKGSRRNLSTDDERFLELADAYLLNDSKDKINILKGVLENGALFVNKKSKYSKDSRRILFTIKDNKNDFFLDKDKAKFWIFDATSGIDLEYKKDYINIIKVNYIKNYNVKLRNINISTSRNNFDDGGFRYMIYNYVANNYNNSTLIASYKSYMEGFKSDRKGHFGGMKGINDHADCINMAHIGLNRFSDIDYLQRYLYLYPDTYDFMKEHSNKAEGILKELLNMEFGNFTNDKMNEVMYSTLLVDTEQNIFRTKLRDYANEDNVIIDLVYNCNTYSKLNNMLKVRLGLDTIEVVEPIEKLEYDILSRDNKEESVAQVIVKWFDDYKGYGAIKTRELLALNNLNQKQFDKSKERNESFKKYMEYKAGDKRGYYVA